MVDTLDRKLLFELQWNCRQTQTQLAKKLRVSKQVIGYRIKQLEKQEIIRSYHVLINWRKLGYNAFRVYWKWKGIEPAEEEQAYKDVLKEATVMWSVKFEGEMDLGFYGWLKDVPDFAKRWLAFMGKYRDHLMKQEFYESVQQIHYPFKVLVEKYPVMEKVVGDGNEVSYDERDYEILRALTENGAMPVVELSRRMRMTPKAVIYRMRQLEKKGIILGYNALLDTNKLGLRFYKVDFYLNDLSRLREMYEYAKRDRNIALVMKTIGGPDFEVEVLVTDVIELKRIILDIRKAFPGTIEHYRFHRFEYTLKQVYLPGEKLAENGKK